jgi:spore maturation protein CgeB
MRVLCVFGQYNYGDATRGEGYEYTSFLPSLKSLGHEVIFFESLDRSKYRNFRELNAALLGVIEQQHPDVIFAVISMYEIWLETWQILRDSCIAATINWTTDDSWKYSQSSRLLVPAFHAFATTYPQSYSRYIHDGFHNVLLTQWAASEARLQSPIRAVDCCYPISFVGTAHGKRKAWIDALRKQGIAVECFGYGWPRGPVQADDIAGIIRNSAISLNFSNSVMRWDSLIPRHENQLKARTFEIPGAGGFLLTEWAQGLERFYQPDHEVAVFHTLRELVEKIRYYQDHPIERDILANKGFRRTCAEHTYGKRLEEAIAFALEQKALFLAKKRISPSRQIDWQRFGQISKQHSMTRGMKLLRQILIGTCSTIWGPTRGPRAARRLVFELSWRVAGARTYSAAGLPGRMFYSVS